MAKGILILVLCVMTVLCHSQTPSNVQEKKFRSGINRTLQKMFIGDQQKRICAGEPICNITNLYNGPKRFTKCMCDENCNLYRDCCLDSPYLNSIVSKKNKQKFNCLPEFPMYLVKTCPKSFIDTNNTKYLCEDITVGEVNENLDVMKPVVDTYSNITYFNSFCATCNNVKNYLSAEIGFDCTESAKSKHPSRRPSPIEYEDIIKNIEYHPKTEAFYSSPFPGLEFECFHKVEFSDRIMNYFRPCLSNMVDYCPQTFADQSVIENCSTFASVVYTSSIIGYGTIYKNEYCAKCNGWDKNLYNCQK